MEESSRGWRQWILLYIFLQEGNSNIHFVSYYFDKFILILIIVSVYNTCNSDK